MQQGALSLQNMGGADVSQITIYCVVVSLLEVLASTQSELLRLMVAAVPDGGLGRVMLVSNHSPCTLPFLSSQEH